MTEQAQYVPDSGPRQAARIEEELDRALQRTCQQVAHAECLDQEQRAEVYTILQALQADTQAHRQLLGVWVRDLPARAREAADA